MAPAAPIILATSDLPMRQLLRTLSLAFAAFTVLIVAALFLLPSDLMNAPVQSAQTTTTSTTGPTTTMSHAEAQALVDRVAAETKWQNPIVIVAMPDLPVVRETYAPPPVIVPAIGPAPTSGAVRFGLTLALPFTLSVLADRARSHRVLDEPEPEP